MTVPALPSRAGQPHPGDWRIHRRAGGALLDGATLTNGVAAIVVEPVAGALKVRLWFKASVAGTLSFTYRRPVFAGGSNPPPAYDTNNPANVAVSANTEVCVTLTDLCGESLLAISFLPSGNGTVTYADIAQV